MADDQRKAWAGLQGSGAAGLVGELMARSSQERDAIIGGLVDTLQTEVKALHKQVKFWRELGERYLEIRRALNLPVYYEDM